MSYQDSWSIHVSWAFEKIVHPDIKVSASWVSSQRVVPPEGLENLMTRDRVSAVSFSVHFWVKVILSAGTPSTPHPKVCTAAMNSQCKDQFPCKIFVIR